MWLSAPEKGDVQRSSHRYLYRGLFESFIEYKLADGERKTPCGREEKIIRKKLLNNCKLNSFQTSHRVACYEESLWKHLVEYTGVCTDKSEEVSLE